jgi:hypothetical protein
VLDQAFTNNVRDMELTATRGQKDSQNDQVFKDQF